MLPYHYSFEPAALAGHELDKLLAMGWYRMHQTVFTSSHVGLDDIYQVHWLRYPILALQGSRSQQRIRKVNRDFKVNISKFSTIAEPHHELHLRYRAAIDFDGAHSIAECLMGDVENNGGNIFDTWVLSIYDNQKLIAGGYFDLGEKSAASILHFYDHDYKRFSLGKYLILVTIDYLRQKNFEYYYPGYVVQGSPKMNYKLFLGKDQAEYFDPITALWLPFNEKILVRDLPA